MEDSVWPDPAQVGTPGEFVAALRRVKDASGLGFRSLEKASGGVLPRSTLTAALSRQTLPRSELVEALVRACGVPDEQVDAWLLARRRLAGGRAETDAEAAVEASAEEPPAVREGLLQGLVPPVMRTGGWPLRVLAGLFLLAPGLAVGLAAGAVFDLRSFADPLGERAHGTGADPRVGTVTEASGRTPWPSPSAPSPPPSGWSVARYGEMTVEDGQQVDFEEMATGQALPGWDLQLDNRGVKISAPAGLAVLDEPVPEQVHRCTRSPGNTWDSQWGPVTSLAPGRVICLATGQGRTVMLTVRQAPDSVTPKLTVRYVIWQRS